MKRLIFIVLLIISFASAYAQPTGYTGFKTPSSYLWIHASRGLLIPTDTVVRAQDSAYIHIASLPGSGTLYLFDSTIQKSWVEISGSGGDVLTDVTYSELNTLVSSNGLTAGAKYRITDFATVYKIYSTATDTTGATEPLIITATSDSTISPIAYSPTNPLDVIYYSLTDETPLEPSSGSKGVILYRHDLANNLSAYYDWREVVWKRWGLANGGLYFAFQQYQSVNDWTFTKTFGSNTSNISIGEGSYNITIGDNSYSINIGQNCGTQTSGIYISADCWAIDIANEVATVATTGAGYIGGVYIGSSSRDIRIGMRSYNIAIGSDCYAI